MIEEYDKWADRELIQESIDHPERFHRCEKRPVGRPPLSVEDKRVHGTITMTPAGWDRLDAAADAVGMTRGTYVEAMVSGKAKMKAPKAAFVPPTLDQLDEYGATLTPKFRDSERFSDFYESKGWLVGKVKMKCWKAAVRNWNRSNAQQSAPKRTPQTSDQFSL